LKTLPTKKRKKSRQKNRGFNWRKNLLCLCVVWSL